MKRSKLLLVMSIFLILSGISGVYSNLSTLLNLSSTNELLAEYGISPFPAWVYVISVIASVITLAAGIVGVIYKSRNLVKIMGILNLVFTIASIIATAICVSFGWVTLIGVIFPILYLWGWKRSK